MKRKKGLIEIEKKLEKNGFVILDLPTRTKNELNQSIDKIFPSNKRFKPVFTCRKHSTFVSEEVKKTWTLNATNGATYYDGKHEQAPLTGFDKLPIKKTLEDWLKDKTGKEGFVLVDVKILRTTRNCH